VVGGRYRLEDLLSEHQGARFWRATDTVLARSVAVHALPSSDPRAAGVLDAARRSARVSDPHFLRVLDCDDDEGLTWVVNEWGEGASLDVMLERSTLPPTRAAWLSREVAEAIAAAHAQGLTHGRLNPESVLVTDAGSVKVIGFVVNAAFEGPAPVHPAYGALGAREADVIDLAGILYAALTGRWPGVAPSAVPAAPRDGRRPLRPRQVRAGVPRTLDAICDRVLHKEAAQHALAIETAHEIAAALSDYVGDPAAAAPVDVPSMYAEPDPPPPVPQQPESADPTEPEDQPEDDRPEDDRPEDHQPEPQGPDPEATMAAPLWTEELVEPEFWAAAPRTAQPDVPPMEEPAPRPLFSEHERRVPPGAPPPPPPDPGTGSTSGTASPSKTGGTRDSGTDPSTDTGTGSRYWPFDDPEDTGSFSGKEGRSWLKLAAFVALCIALLVGTFVAFDLTRGKGDTPSSPDTTQSTTPAPIGTPIRIVGARDFDPEGDPPEENPDQVPLAIDGKPDTGWRTLTYKDDPHLGGLKSGVGLVLDLGSQQEVGSVTVTLVGAPTDLEVYVAPPGVDNSPAELADTRRVAGTTAEGTQAVIRLDPKPRTRFVLVWLTKLPPASGGFRGEVAEVAVRS
jgi:serine/threonine protein kinase